MKHHMKLSGWSDTAVIADILTMARMVIAVALIPIVWSFSLGLAALMVSIAWMTDLLDGRLARAAGREGRLGSWDLRADTAVGAGLLIGLTGAGTIPIWFSASALIIFGVLFLAGNLAASMLLQLAGYLPLISVLWSEKSPGWWLPFFTAILIGILDWRRLLFVNIPNFVRGLSGKTDLR
jgi:phosphatidylglycerophosphate synthase